MMKIQEILGRNVRFFRERKGWSQDYLSEVSGLHRTYISGIERAVRNPTICIVQQLSDALDTNVSDLLKESLDD